MFRCNQRGVSLQLWIVAIAPIDSIWWMDEGFGGDCHDRPSEALSSRYDGLQAALRLRLRLHGVVHDMPSSMAGLGGMGARRYGGKLLHPSGETAIFRELFVGEGVAFLGVSRSHYMPKHAPTCGRHLCGGVF